MARRKLYPKSTRVRLTDDEYRHLSECAKVAGLSISRYLIRGTLGQQPMTSLDFERADALFLQRDWAINEVARVGNNINQIARQLNSQRGSLSSERIEQALIEVTGVLDELHRLLSEPESK